MRKAILLAMAATVVAMFAIPGTASAQWTKHHEANAQNVELELTGTNLKFTGEAGAIECHTISKSLFEAGTTGTVKTFEEQGKASEVCDASGLINHCTVNDVVADGLPWVFHTASTTTVSVTTGTITNDLSGFLCPDPDLTPGTVTFTVDNTNTTSTASLGGTLQGDNPNQTVTVSGQLHLLGPVTYGI